MLNVFASDLIFPHANFLDRLVENIRFGLVDWIVHGLIEIQVDTGRLAGRVDTRSFLFLLLHVGHCEEWVTSVRTKSQRRGVWRRGEAMS